MSGNSRDRRKFRRFVEKVLGIQFPAEQTPQSAEQRMWSWSVVGIGCPTLWTIGGIAMSGQHLIVPDIFFVAGAVLLLAKFFSWQRTTAVKLRSWAIVVVVAVLPTSLLIEINHRAPPFPFPWISTANQSNEEIGLQVVVRDYPLDSSLNTVGSSASLFHINILISQIVSVSKEGESWHSQEIASVNKEEWSNELGNQVIAWLPVKNQVTVLEILGTSRDAHWDGYIILRREKGRIQRFEAMRGAVTFTRTTGKLALTEEVKNDDSGKLYKCITQKFHPLTKKRLLEYGIPES